MKASSSVFSQSGDSASHHSLILSPVSGKSTLVVIFSLQRDEALKRFKWNVRRSGKFHNVILCLPSRSTLHFGQRQQPVASSCCSLQNSVRHAPMCNPLCIELGWRLTTGSVSFWGASDSSRFRGQDARYGGEYSTCFILFLESGFSNQCNTSACLAFM